MAGKATLTGETLRKSIIMLQHVTAMLDRMNIEYCLECGTLLGIVREQRLLPWDTDMDLMVPWKDRVKLYWSARIFR